jgi:diguanylate cyclase (GGDEF)-like protein
VGDWFFAPEFVALGVLIVLLFYMRGSYSVAIRHTRMFCTVLWISVGCISSNILSTSSIVHSNLVPLWLNDLFQMLYFFTTPFMAASIVTYILLQVQDEFRNKQIFKWLFTIYGVTIVSYLAVAATNPFTHVMYWFDEDLLYVRGPLNFLTMGLSLFYIFSGILGCLILWKYISPQLRRVLKWFPLLVLALLTVQVIFPNVQMSGTAAMFCCLVSYLNFQSSKLTTDSLTLCGNRLVFINSLDYYMRYKQALTIIAINIRQFKRINEELGTYSGDMVLRNIGEMLRNLPYQCEAFRIGGDKFALIWQPTRSGSATDVERYLVERFENPWTVDGVEINLEADLVSLMCPQIASKPDEILSFLEYALALPPENSGEDHIPAPVEVRICDASLRSKMHRREDVVSLLRKALLTSGFSYVYQPIMDIDGRKIEAAECLIRMNDPRTGAPIPPSEFIPYAETAGLIPQIGMKVFENTCKFIHHCEEKGISAPPISVNFSTRQFYNESMVDHVMTLLKRWNVAPDKIKIEVTEGTFIANYFRVESVMSRLIDNGLGFYLDDFGSGYASFSRMMSLPFECIKFDQSILSNSQSQRRMHEMLGYLVEGFAHLGTRVVVEGVETAEQIAYLKALNVRSVQGFYYARPLSEETFCASLAATQANGDLWKETDSLA